MSSVLRSLKGRKKTRRLGRIEIVDRERYRELEVDMTVPRGSQRVARLVMHGVTHPRLRQMLKSAGVTGSKLEAVSHDSRTSGEH